MEVDTTDLSELVVEMKIEGTGSIVLGHEHHEDPHEFIFHTIDTLRERLELELGNIIDIKAMNVPHTGGRIKEFICSVRGNSGGGGHHVHGSPSLPSGRGAHAYLAL